MPSTMLSTSISHLGFLESHPTAWNKKVDTAYNGMVCSASATLASEHLETQKLVSWPISLQVLVYTCPQTRKKTKDSYSLGFFRSINKKLVFGKTQTYPQR